MFSPLLQWENDTFGDIHMIDMEENMNDGKTYEYFASMAAMYGNGSREERRWDYVMKVDDDTFLHLGNLVERLRGMRREKVWFVGIPGSLSLSCPILLYLTPLSLFFFLVFFSRFFARIWDAILHPPFQNPVPVC